MNVLKEKINELIQIENELKIITDKGSTLKEQKQTIEKDIKELMVKENLTDKVLVLQNKKIKYNEHKTYQSYSFHYLEEKLKELMDDNNNVNYILNYLKQNRKTNINSEIKILDYNNE